MSRTPTTKGASQTRDRILDAALELFNQQGTSSVTTNHVAARACISPGNLYYWFADKNEIIRELHARFVAAYEHLWGDGHGAPPNGAPVSSDPLELTPDEVLARLADGAALSGRYTFLARDLLGLLHGDPVLAAQYGAVRQRRLIEFTDLAHAWRSQGVICRLDDSTIADLVEALWIVAETWLAFAELDGSHPDTDRGARLLRVVLRPYLTQDAPA